jgi:hypothetical protein
LRLTTPASSARHGCLLFVRRSKSRNLLVERLDLPHRIEDADVVVDRDDANDTEAAAVAVRNSSPWDQFGTTVPYSPSSSQSPE